MYIYSKSQKTVDVKAQNCRSVQAVQGIQNLTLSLSDYKTVENYFLEADSGNLLPTSDAAVVY